MLLHRFLTGGKVLSYEAMSNKNGSGQASGAVYHMQKKDHCAGLEGVF